MAEREWDEVECDRCNTKHGPTLEQMTVQELAEEHLKEEERNFLKNYDRG